MDLGEAWDQYTPDVGGIPLGVTRVNGVPFRFAGAARTHETLTAGSTLAWSFPMARVADLHVVYGGLNLPGDANDEHPLLEVRLLSGGRTVFCEELQSTRHICDWWAPRGEHMWAGGGLRYTDPARVTYALTPGAYYGLMHLSGFRPRGLRADRLELRSLAPQGSRETVAIFAVTVQGRQVQA